tara:strand:+ start:327 stop:1985 length:1659 start_codon:yes stop_codon:yes gene_type:complete
MKIIVPMSGFGERFRKVGYDVPKPLISVDNFKFIEHVVNMFSPNEEFIFVCNKEHLNKKEWNLKGILSSLAHNYTIIGIEPHKLGPIHAVLSVRHLIKDKEPIVVNYCDFTCYWDWEKFKLDISKNNYVGAIPAYKGFHPHSLGTTNYAYIKEKNNFLIDIKEKEPFTNNRIDEYASSGTYFFAKGELLISSFEEVIKRDLNINGEYYVSLAYKILAEIYDNIYIYPLQHFMQWGTPQDLQEYQQWSETFGKINKQKKENNIFDGTLIIPMAGLGKRFSKEGYLKTKPLIEVSGKPMVTQAIDDLPIHKNNIFVLREDMQFSEEIKDKLRKQRPECIIKSLPSVTDGQANTVLEGINVLDDSKINSKFIQPVTISACDNGVIFNWEEYKNLLNNHNIDVIVWGFRGFINAKRNPEMYGWIDCDKNGKIKSVSVKKPINNDLNLPIIIGTFTFKSLRKLKISLERLISSENKVNGEFYVDSCINNAIKMGLNCHYFQVEEYICWGTPNDLKTFEYWQSCFHKWKYHAYKIQNDLHIPQDKIQSLEKRFYNFNK